MGGMGHAGHEVKVVLGVAPPIAGQAAAIALPDGARVLLKGPPIIVPVLTFDLVGRGGGAPQESPGEGHLIHL